MGCVPSLPIVQTAFRVALSHKWVACTTYTFAHHDGTEINWCEKFPNHVYDMLRCRPNARVPTYCAKHPRCGQFLILIFLRYSLSSFSSFCVLVNIENSPRSRNLEPPIRVLGLISQFCGNVVTIYSRIRTRFFGSGMY